MSQKVVCGMRRFDKHRVASDNRQPNTTHAAELEERLRQRDSQDYHLFGIATPATTPILTSIQPSSSPPVLSSPVLSSPVYTAWKTPSASSATPGK
jgi:hypothetical protein